MASNPEFLAQGTAIADTLHASRIVIGVEEEASGETLRRVYRDFDAPILVTNRRSAEMIKYASNDFLALKHELVLLINKFNRSTTAIHEKELLSAMGFPENWTSITRFRKL